MNKPAIKTLIAFDFGTKRIGTAVGQAITQTARPLDTIPNSAQGHHWQTIGKLVKQWQPDALVVGIPLNMDGSEQAITETARLFAQSLKQHFNLPVFESDERLTTKAAREILFNEGGYKALKQTSVDAYAAKLILEEWFTTQSKT